MIRHAVMEATREADAAKLRRKHPFVAKYFPYFLRFFGWPTGQFGT
jgi:hypothetical protein